MGAIRAPLIEPWRSTVVKDSLKTGLSHELTYVVPAERTVPHLLPESDEFTAMPNVLATGYLVGIVEWACMESLSPHLEDEEISLGIHINLSHDAATLVGWTIKVETTIQHIDHRAVTFDVKVTDDQGTVVSNGTHRRGVVNRERFLNKLDSQQEARSAE